MNHRDGFVLVAGDRVFAGWPKGARCKLVGRTAGFAQEMRHQFKCFGDTITKDHPDFYEFWELLHFQLPLTEEDTVLELREAEMKHKLSDERAQDENEDEDIIQDGVDHGVLYVMAFV